MKSGSFWLISAGLALGLVLGVVWSPLQENEEREETQTTSGGGGSSGSSRFGGGESGSRGVPSKTARERSTRRHRVGSGQMELTTASLLDSFLTIEDEDEMNLMDLARKVGMIAEMSESQVYGLLQALSVEDEDESRNTEGMRGILGGIVFTRLCELNGPEAMRMAVAGELGKEFDEDFTVLGMNSWVAADPEGASDWFHGLLGDADALANSGGKEADMEGMMKLLQEEDFMEAALRGLAKHDSESLTTRIEELEHPDVRESMEAKVFAAEVRVEETADGLLSLLDSNTSEEGRSARLNAVEKLSALDPKKAAEWVEGYPVSGERDRMVANVASQLLAKNPSEGAEWYMSQEILEESHQAQRLRAIVSRVGSNNYDEGVAWLEGQPDDRRRDQAEFQLAQIASTQRRYRESLDWINDISDKKVQNQALQQVFRRGYDREAKTMNGELLEAAEAAGFGEEASEYGGR